MDEIPITYEKLYELLRIEKSRDELQELDATFFNDVLSYLQEKERIYENAQNKVDLFSVAEKDKVRSQIGNVRRIVKKLYESREKKVITMAINKSRTQSAIIDTANLLEEERILYNALVGEMDFFRQGILQNLFLLREPKVRRDMSVLRQDDDAPLPVPKMVEPQKSEVIKPSITRVKFTQKMPQFVGEELELYGPFDQDEEADLPPQVADLVIANGGAVLV